MNSLYSPQLYQAAQHILEALKIGAEPLELHNLQKAQEALERAEVEALSDQGKRLNEAIQ